MDSVQDWPISNGLLSLGDSIIVIKTIPDWQQKISTAICLQLFFLTQKNPLSHRSTGLKLTFFYWRGRHSLNSLLVIRTSKNFISSTFYQRPINPMPIIRPSNKKPSSKDIRIVFPDFLPPKLDWLLTIVMLIGIRHCQESHSPQLLWQWLHVCHVYQLIKDQEKYA